MNALTLFSHAGHEHVEKTSYYETPVFLILSLLLALIILVAWWKVFEKAKKPGWAAIIPIYNIYTQLKIVNRPGWWLILYLIPFVNVITHIVVAIDMAKAFGRTPTFGVVGLWLFSFIGYIILGFGEDKYKGLPKR